MIVELMNMVSKLVLIVMNGQMTKCFDCLLIWGMDALEETVVAVSDGM